MEMWVVSILTDMGIAYIAFEAFDEIYEFVPFLTRCKPKTNVVLQLLLTGWLVAELMG